MINGFIAVGIALAPATGGASLLVTIPTTIAGVGMGEIIGSSVGSFVGGKIGEATGEDKYEWVSMGDNSEEVILNFKEARTKHFAEIAKQAYEDLQEKIFNSLQNQSSKIVEIVNKFENEIQTFKKELQC